MPHLGNSNKSMSQTSDQPFGKAVRALMTARGLTYRGLSDAIGKLDDRGITHAHLNMLANGREKPSMRAMELIARACEVTPEYFAEYRLAVEMRELDPGEVGLQRALENLNLRLAARRRSAATARRGRRPPAQPHPKG